MGDLVMPEWEYLSSRSTSSVYTDIIERGRIVSVSVGQSSPAFQRSLSTLVKSLFQQAALAHLSRRTPGQRKPFYLLACDEYAQVITEGQTGLVSDSRFFSLSREAGCLSLLALQSVATGRSRFSADMHDRWEGILGNVTVKFFMKLNDVETAKMASDLAGSQHSFVQVLSQQQSAQGLSVTDSPTMLEHPRVPPWYLTNRLPQGHAMVHGTLDGKAMPTAMFVRVPQKP
jgi:type IV secretory pathway TraG/TraD family ATPase VirD4